MLVKLNYLHFAWNSVTKCRVAWTICFYWSRFNWYLLFTDHWYSSLLYWKRLLRQSWSRRRNDARQIPWPRLSKSKTSHILFIYLPIVHFYWLEIGHFTQTRLFVKLFFWTKNVFPFTIFNREDLTSRKQFTLNRMLLLKVRSGPNYRRQCVLSWQRWRNKWLWNYKIDWCIWGSKFDLECIY